jgi:hypothetical protein
MVSCGIISCRESPKQSANVTVAGQNAAQVQLASRTLLNFIRLRFCLPDSKLQSIPNSVAQKLEQVYLASALDSEIVDDLKKLPNVNSLYFNVPWSIHLPEPRQDMRRLNLPTQIQSITADIRQYHMRGNLDVLFGNLAKNSREVSSFTFHLKATDSTVGLLTLADEFPGLEKIRIVVDQIEDQAGLSSFLKAYKATKVQLPAKFSSLKSVTLEVYKDEHDIYVEKMSRIDPKKPFTTQSFGDLKEFTW